MTIRWTANRELTAPAASMADQPWTADAYTIVENRQGRITEAQRTRIRREALRDAAILAGTGLGVVASLVLAYLCGYIVYGGVWILVAICLGGAPTLLVRAYRETRPGALCGWAAGPVQARLKTDGLRRGQTTFSVSVGGRQLTHVGGLAGLAAGAPYYAYFLQGSGRILAMERIPDAPYPLPVTR